MKKIYGLLIIIAFAFSLASCQKSQIVTNKKTIVTTLYPEYEMVKAIISDDKYLNEVYEVILLMPYGCDIHAYDPSISDLLIIKNAYAFIYTADEMEKWVEKIDFDPSTIILNLSLDDRIVLLETEESEEEHEEEHQGHHHTYDPHLWIYPVYAKYMVEQIRDLLIKITPDPYQLYQNNIVNNANNYIKKLEVIDESIKQVVEVATYKTLYFGCPFSFYYWSVYYGLSYELTYLTCSTEVEPSLIDVMKIVQKMKDNNIKTIYTKELLSTQAADAIASYTGANVIILHSGHNISNLQVGDDNYSFINIMRQNVYNLAIGLNVDTKTINDFALERGEN